MVKMDGRKFDWIRKQLGLSKVELARRLGISRQSLYRCIWDGPPKLVALAILGLWYQDRMGGLLEEASEPEEKAVQKPRGKQGNRRSNKREKFFVESVTIEYIIANQYLSSPLGERKRGRNENPLRWRRILWSAGMKLSAGAGVI